MERNTTELKNAASSKLTTQPQAPHIPSTYMPTGDDPATRAVPAMPPIWTRYIDSRLKQFCTR
ncbi:MAG TPA: hypothetical protein VH370_17565 [Humisphaera sp.]|jgi:hypothetical protein|nr:hypothetical protein [Humisphaera sp.]